MGKPTLCYYVERRRSDGGYLHDRLTIVEAETVDTAARLAGTIDNKDGYGTEKAAKDLGRAFAALLRDGHPTFYDSALRGLRVEFRYQVYKEVDGVVSDYCTPRIEWPYEYERCGEAHALVGKLGRRIEKARAKKRADDQEPRKVRHWTFEEALRELAEALDSMGALRVEWWEKERADSPWKDRYMVPAVGQLPAVIPFAA